MTARVIDAETGDVLPGEASEHLIAASEHRPVSAYRDGTVWRSTHHNSALYRDMGYTVRTVRVES